MNQTFVKQHYLIKKVQQRPTADGEQENIPVYSMGARSILEVRRRGWKLSTVVQLREPLQTEIVIEYILP